ncbi:hypothetical protein [Klebsiella pneumoniae]
MPERYQYPVDEGFADRIHTPEGVRSLVVKSQLMELLREMERDGHDVSDAVTPGTIPYRFRKWVTSEVLPQIRKTGRYVREELSQADKARMLAQEMTSSMLPAIMDALQVEQKHYTFPLNRRYQDHIHSPDGLRELAKSSMVMKLLRELDADGHDVSGAAAEVTAMLSYIVGIGAVLRDIETHAQYVMAKAKGY